MKVGIVGASASGVYVAMLTKRLHPDWDIALFDHAPKLARKLYATGNGHCNILNAKIDPKSYSHPEFVASIIKDKPLEYWLDLLSGFGIAVTQIGDLIYPISYSAATYVASLASILKSEKVEIHLPAEVTDYSYRNGRISLEASIGNFEFDRLVIATGGKSQSKLGSDGSIFSVLDKHGYRVVPLQPGLCPIKTKEVLKPLDGLRHKAIVTLKTKGEELYRENGEILFKKDGLSGIAIFNCSSIIARSGTKNEYTLSLDLFPGLEEGELRSICEKARKQFGEAYLEYVVEKPLAEYLMKLGGDPIRHMKDLRFHFSGLYDFDQSQVSVGGLDLAEITLHLESKKEKGIYFVGEVLDVDGLCGGHNLGWCLFSAAEVANSL